MSDLPIYDSGLVFRKNPEHRVTSLPTTVGVNRSLLNAPIYVLHPKATKNSNSLEVSWDKKIQGELVPHQFRFLRVGNIPYPTVVHAKYLDIMLSMFAQSWNQEGLLYFRYCDIVKIAGTYEDSAAIQQTILRYHSHITEWKNCWQGYRNTLTFPIIKASSILDSGGFKKRSPGRSLKKENWHTVVFAPEIVTALKNEKKRIFLTELFHELKNDTFCVYRYFYGYPDFYLDERGKQKPNVIWRSIDSLQKIFHWGERKDRFLIWFKARIEELLALDLIDPPAWNQDAVGIHCKNLEELQKQRKGEQPTVIPLLSGYTHQGNVARLGDKLVFRDTEDPLHQPRPAKRNTLSASKKVAFANVADLSDQHVIEEYYSRKANHLVNYENSGPIDMLLANGMTAAALSLIKSHVLTEYCW
jgi:hypothetical protein